MHATQPIDSVPTPPFGAVVARQLSVWPFASRTQRLYLLVDPSAPQPSLRAGLLRAMQQAYFRSDSFSQTRAVREAALAAHYVLLHHNRDVLPQAELTAAAAVAAVRGGLAYVALSGNAAAFAWRNGDLVGQRGTLKKARPLGVERDPAVTLWSTPLEPGDRLILICGARWTAQATRTLSSILESAAPGETAERQLSDALAHDGGPVGVLVADPVRRGRPERHLVLVSSVERGRVTTPSAPATARSQAVPPAARRHAWPSVRLIASLLLMLILGSATVAALQPSTEPPRETLVLQARALLDLADTAPDMHQAHALTSDAFALVQRTGLNSPDAADLAALATQKLATVDRVVPVTGRVAVRLGPAGGNVVDLAVGDALYTLDVAEASVRAFGLDALDASPTPDTMVARAGMPIGGTTQSLAAPVAIRYLVDQAGQGALTIVDQARTVVSASPDRRLSARALSSSGGWMQIGALGGDGSSDLFVLDSGSRRLLRYAARAGSLVDPPRTIVDAATAPRIAFDHAADIVAAGDALFIRFDTGTVQRVDASGQASAFDVRLPDDRPLRIAGLASDRAGGLYLADPDNGRVLHTTADGELIAQLRNPSFAGVRQIQSSLDGRRLYGLVASGVLVFEVSATLPSA